MWQKNANRGVSADASQIGEGYSPSFGHLRLIVVVGGVGDVDGFPPPFPTIESGEIRDVRDVRDVRDFLSLFMHALSL